MKHNFFLLGFFLTACLVKSQPHVELNNIISTYPDVKFVVVNNKRTLDVDVVRGKLLINSHNYEECLYTDTRVGVYSDRSLQYSEFDKIEKINAHTLVPGKKKYKKVKINEFKTDSIISDDAFYDGTFRVSFLYPSLQQGAKTVLEYQKIIPEPRLIGTFFFQEFVPVLSSEYSITASDKVELGWKLFNTDSLPVDFTMEKKDNKVTYRWKILNLDRHNRESDSPDIRYTMPHIVPWIKSYKSDEKNTIVLNNLQDLYNWYYSISKGVNKEHCPDLQRIVDTLVAGETSEIEKVRKIFYWVQDNIKYIAVENGMGGFVPRSAKSVFEKRYGDCKDMASIVNTMISYAGIITSYLTWIGSRAIPYSYSQLPNPAVDNHMIVTYINNDKYYFLDATGKYMPLELPTPFIQGKEALIGIDSVRYLIKEVPVIPLAKNSFVDSIEIHLEKNNIIGRGKAIMNGYYDFSTSSYLLSNPKKEKKQLLRDYLEKGSNKFLLEDFTLGDLNDRDKPLDISYSFNIHDYARENHDELYLNLVLDRTFMTMDISDERENDIEKEYNGGYIGIVNFKIPEGYKVNYIPAGSSFENEKFGFNIKYSRAADTIRLDYSAFTNILSLKKTDFALWKSMIKKLQKASSEMVVLQKI